MLKRMLCLVGVALAPIALVGTAGCDGGGKAEQIEGGQEIKMSKEEEEFMMNMDDPEAKKKAVAEGKEP